MELQKSQAVVHLLYFYALPSDSHNHACRFCSPISLYASYDGVPTDLSPFLKYILGTVSLGVAGL